MDHHDLLHRARLDRQIGLTEIGLRTALSPAVLQRIDEGRLGELPPGVYARAYVRLFAAEVGIDPDHALRQVAPLLPEAPDPFPVLQQIASMRRNWPAVRFAAAATDALILFIINALIIAVVCFGTGTTVEVVLSAAGAGLAALCCAPVITYFAVFAGIGGRTPGAALWKVPAPPRTALTLSVILERTLAPVSIGRSSPSAPAQLADLARSR